VVGPVAVPSAQRASFAYGVAAADVTQSSALLWTRAPHAGIVTLAIGKRRIRVEVRSGDDLTATVKVKGLKPATGYVYRFVQGKASGRGRFRTAPASGANVPVEFSLSGDADAQRAPGASKPFFNDFQVYDRMAEERNDFAVDLGDTIYSDSEVPGVPLARTVAEKRAKYRQNLALAPLQRLRASTSVYNEWDDHEFVNDFSRAEFGDELYAAGKRAFLDYMPATYSQLGLYRTFRWGKNLQLFILDERSFRSAKASAGGACDNPPGTPDLAPTAPQPVRNAFATLIPSLASPVAQKCLDLIADPSRTMLGAAQLARFERDVATSTATFKVVVNEVPFHEFYALPYDRWEGYAAERQSVLGFLGKQKNVVVLSTDTHADFFGEVRSSTLLPGGPVGTGVDEMVTGPVATGTFANEIDAAVGQAGSGSLITALFLKPQPPRGVGFQCANTNVFSYVHVRVTSSALTITPKDLDGKLVQDASLEPCGPFTVAAK
jgi:phosphodiesterase/alkaline phosphatase D-like protein